MHEMRKKKSKSPESHRKRKKERKRERPVLALGSSKSPTGVTDRSTDRPLCSSERCISHALCREEARGRRRRARHAAKRGEQALQAGESEWWRRVRGERPLLCCRCTHAICVHPVHDKGISSSMQQQHQPPFVYLPPYLATHPLY